MKSPYETALRAMQREMDDLRTAIQTAAERLVEIEGARQRLSDTIARETQLKALEWSQSAEGFLGRARTERARLATERQAATAQLDGLRHQARERYGSLRAMETADQSWREDLERAAATTEQARMDDVIGARFARDLRRARTRAGRDVRIG